VGGLWVLPFVVMILFGVILVAGSMARSGVVSPESELRALVREDDLAALIASLRREPAFVLSSRCSPLRNRLVMDLGDVELDVCCYSVPRTPVDVVLGISYQSSVGWVVETTGRGGAARLYGWLLDVRSRRRTIGEPGEA
jgi:hypothetical protein